MTVNALFQQDRFGLWYPRPERAEKLFLAMAWVAFGLGALLFVALPVRRVTDLLGPLAGTLTRYGGFGVFFLGLTGLVAWRLARFFAVLSSAPESREIPSAKREWPAWARAAQVGLSVAIGVQAVLQADLPFDLDEYQRLIGALTQSFWHEINPFRHTEVHSVSHFFANLSVKIFGPSRLAFRAPSLLFAGLFLVALGYLSRRFLSPVAGLVVLAHLAVNQMVIWYLHSMRGYVSALFVTTVLWAILLEAVERLPERRRQRLVLFAVFFFLSVFTHPFTGIYSLVLFLSLVLWASWNADRLGRERLVYLSQLLTIAMLCLPFFAVVFVCVLRSLEPIANVHKGGYEQFLSYVALTVPAMGRLWALKALGAVVALAAVSRCLAGKSARPGLLSLFVGNTVAFFGAVLWLLKVSHLEPRWFLPFLVPFVMWAVDSVSRAESRLRPGLLVAVVALLTYFPWASRQAVLETLGIGLHARYETFLEEVRERTEPVAENCYAFPPFNMGRWANWFHFAEQPRSIAERARCRKHYLISLERGPLDPPPGAEVVFADGHGNVAYAVPPSRP